jgi:hypothetical protein
MPQNAAARKFLAMMAEDDESPAAEPIGGNLHAQATKKNLWRAIRAKCLNCTNGQPGEVRTCEIKGCALHPYRFGRSRQSC